ncbi:MAG: hypothetical protein EBS84_19130, partial [Proteobacteria bacterium]|nr:hypothetical protein [Verrucomicrobiota bacterium]NBU11102.1 hypothetical protein [Pseudomonadota bacterium]
MKTNAFTATNETKTAKVVAVRFAPEVAVRIKVRQNVSVAWVSHRPLAATGTPRLGMRMLLALLIALFGNATTQPASAALTNASTDLAVLVVAATGQDAALPAIRQALDF